MKMLGMVPVEKLKPNEWNAVELKGDDESKLKAQMRISGPERTEAITVRRVGDVWEIVNGEKRWRIKPFGLKNEQSSSPVALDRGFHAPSARRPNLRTASQQRPLINAYYPNSEAS